MGAGTRVEMYNALICGKGKVLTVETTETENALSDGTSKLENVSIDGELESENNIYTNDMFAAATGNLTKQAFEWSDLYVGTEEGGAAPADGFFTTANYKGAVAADNNWTSGWTL